MILLKICILKYFWSLNKISQRCLVRKMKEIWTLLGYSSRNILHHVSDTNIHTMNSSTCMATSTPRDHLKRTNDITFKIHVQFSLYMIVH